MTTRVADGVHVEVTTTGEGEPLVVIPGGPARHPAYLEELGGLTDDGYGLITLYPPSVCPSRVPEDASDYAASRLVDDVDTLRIALGLETLTLVAHFAGAAVALEYTARFPERAGRLVLITPAADVGGLRSTPEESEGQLARMADEPWYADARRAADEIEVDGVTPERRRAILPLFYGVWDDAAREHAARNAEQTNLEGRLHYFDDRPDPAVLGLRLAAVTCPVRILVGELDPDPGPGVAGRLARLFPDATAATIPGAGQFPWVTVPEAFRTALLEALRS